MAELSTETSELTLHAEPGKYLTFHLAGEFYGMGILKVQEIIGIMAVTHVPKMPKFVRGVINLRGQVIPVVELRSKFDLPHADDTEKTCIIVVQVGQGSTLATIGLIVDEVAEVVNLQANQLEPTPTFGADVDTKFIQGIGKMNDRVIMLLDIERILNDCEQAGLSEVLSAV